jgi:hypothetical protein
MTSAKNAQTSANNTVSSDPSSSHKAEVANAQLLSAGAILPVGAPTPPAVPVAEQIVRSFRHRMLGDRVVAKITSTDLAPAVDATLDFLGFHEPKTTAAVGLALYGALGFPESALIADPKNARYALAVVKDLAKLGRMAKSRAGAAKEGMEKLAAELAKSVPHFLPSYFEQCGRLFVGVENVAYGGAMFVKARTAEATFGLPIDEEQRRSTFLEFAFAGALPAKALDDYAKDLARVYPPDIAFAHFRTLALHRSRGGLAPWAQMMEVTKRMAKAANVNVDDAQSELLAELLGCPSLRFASHTFWKSIRPIAVRKAREDPSVRGSFLNLHPVGSFGAWWFDFLQECNAFESLCTLSESDVPESTRPIGSPAEWLSRISSDVGTGSLPGLPELLTKMAPRLIDDKIPVQLHSYRMSLDVLDLALELGIPCTPSEYQWFSYRFSDAFTRPLLAIANAPSLAVALKRSVRESIANNQTMVLFDTPGLRPLLAEWLAECLDAIDPPDPQTGKGAYEFDASARELIRVATPEMLNLVDGARERILRADPAAVSARHLRAGIFAEFTWPILEQVISSLTSQGNSVPAAKSNQQVLSLTEAWPQLIVHDNMRAYVIDHDRVLLEHDLKWKTDGWRRMLGFVDGALYVAWQGSGWGPGTVGSYWSNNPSVVFTDNVDFDSPSGQGNQSVPVEGGGRTTGGRSIQVGDRSYEHFGQVIHDGRNYWVGQHNYVNGHYRHVFTEFDPVTGRHGRASLPSFAEQQVTADRSLQRLELYPLPTGIQETPLGSNDGFVGSVVVCTQDRLNVEAVRIDGKRSGLQNDVGLMTLIDWPFASEPYLVSYPFKVSTPGAVAVTETATWPTLHGASIPPRYWHHFAVRDRAGSEKLRTVTVDDVASVVAKTELLVSQAPVSKQFDPRTYHPELAATLAESLPSVTDPTLRLAVTEPIAIATVATLNLVAWLNGASAVGALQKVSAHSEPVERSLTLAAHGILHTDSSMALRTQLDLLQKFFVSDLGTIFDFDYNVSRSLSTDGLSPLTLITAVPATAYSALLPSTPVEQREAALTFVESWLESAFSHAENFSYVNLQIPFTDNPQGTLRWGNDGTPWWLSRAETNVSNNERHYNVVALAGHPRAGAAQAPGNEASVITSVPLVAAVSPDAIRRLIDLIRAHGPIVAMTAEAVTVFAQRCGISRAEAATVLSGLRGLGYYGGPEIDKATRELFKVKAGELKAAADYLRQAQAAKRQRALINALFVEPESLWTLTAEGFGERLGDAWAAEFGKKVPIDDQLLAIAEKTVVTGGYGGHKARAVLADVNNSEPLYRGNPTYAFDAQGDFVVTPQEAGLYRTWITALTRAIAMIVNDRPIGDPWRTFAADTIRRVVASLNDPSVILQWDNLYINNPAYLRFVDEYPPQQMGQRLLHDAGDVIFVRNSPQVDEPTLWYVYIRPSRYRVDSPARSLADVMGVDEQSKGFALVDWFLNGRANLLADHLGTSSLPAGSYEQNPIVSTPIILEAVKNELKLDTDPAALYLQLLTLAEPTTANIKLWNGWTVKQVASASQELIDAGLVVAAKRVGAGRELFLPGSWAEMRTPAMNLEDWKTPMYLITNNQSGKRSSHLNRVLPLDPIPALFERAWTRWAGGDRPGFVEAGRGLGERKKK